MSIGSAKITTTRRSKIVYERRKATKIIVAIAKINGMTIHPAIGYDYFVGNLLLLGHCACVPGREHCPCPESVYEVAEEGKCKCGLYWKDLETWMNYDPTNPGKKLVMEA